MRVPLLLCATLWVTGCGVETDDRPATVEYVTAAVLRPSCATATCHSSASATEGFSFETVEEVLASDLAATDEPLTSTLFLVLLADDYTDDWRAICGTSDEPRCGLPKMPRDSPLPDADIALIERWIASPGDR